MKGQEKAGFLEAVLMLVSEQWAETLGLWKYLYANFPKSPTISSTEAGIPGITLGAISASAMQILCSLMPDLGHQPIHVFEQTRTHHQRRAQKLRLGTEAMPMAPNCGG